MPWLRQMFPTTFVSTTIAVSKWVFEVNVRDLRCDRIGAVIELLWFAKAHVSGLSVVNQR
jgi:hypothetical protein